MGAKDKSGKKGGHSTTEGHAPPEAEASSPAVDGAADPDGETPTEPNAGDGLDTLEGLLKAVSDENASAADRERAKAALERFKPAYAAALAAVDAAEARAAEAAKPIAQLLVAMGRRGRPVKAAITMPDGSIEKFTAAHDSKTKEPVLRRERTSHAETF